MGLVRTSFLLKISLSSILLILVLILEISFLSLFISF